MDKHYKVIMVGPQLVGKTTLVRYFRAHTDLPVLELDEEIMRLNNGVWPKDDNYKNQILVPKIENDIKNRKNSIFVTSYFSKENIKDAKQNGFKVIQLELGIKKLKNRNVYRMKHEGYDDASKWFQQNLRYQKQIQKEGLVDKMIYTDKAVEKVAREIIKFLND